MIAVNLMNLMNMFPAAEYVLSFTSNQNIFTKHFDLPRVSSPCSPSTSGEILAELSIFIIFLILVGLFELIFWAVLGGIINILMNIMNIDVLNCDKRRFLTWKNKKSDELGEERVFEVHHPTLALPLQEDGEGKRKGGEEED